MELTKEEIICNNLISKVRLLKIVLKIIVNYYSE